MSKKIRSIVVNIFINHKDFDNLEGIDIDTLQESLRNIVSAKGNGENCFSVARIIPTIAKTNSVEIELADFTNKKSLTDDEELVYDIIDLIDQFVDADIEDWFLRERQSDPFIHFGNIN